MFFKQVNKKESGITLISNFFLDIFMPMANGLYVQVYLLGYRYACDPNSNMKFDNQSLARNLNVPLSDVVKAWKYWEEQKIVIIHPNDSTDKFNFSVEFVDLTNFYMKNVQNENTPVKSDMDTILEARENPSIVKMFNSINKIIGRPLAPNESIRLLELLQEYNLTPDLIVLAYEHTKEVNGNPKPLRYVESVLRNWYDENIMTIEDAQNSFIIRKNRYSIYGKVLKELGFYNRQVKDPEKEMIDTWLDKYEMSEELILYACSKSINTSNPTVTYINGIIEKWHEKNIVTIEDAKKEEEEFRKRKDQKIEEAKKQTQNSYSNNNGKSTPNKNVVKTRYHDTFTEHFRNYSPDELERKLLDMQRNKLQNKKGKEGD